MYEAVRKTGLPMQWLNDIVAYMKNQGAGADGQHSAIDNWFWCAPMYLQLHINSRLAVPPVGAAASQAVESARFISASSLCVCRWAWPTNSGDTKGIVDTNWLDIRFDKV